MVFLLSIVDELKSDFKCMFTKNLYSFLTVISLAWVMLFTSCIPNKRIAYLQQGKGDLPIEVDSLISYSIPVYRLQYNDIVEVQIKTTIPEMNAVFGLKNPDEFSTPGNQMNVSQGAGDAYYMSGYTVDQKGQIKLPFLGEVDVMGLTLTEAEAAITKKLSKYFEKSLDDKLYVNVKLGGIRFSTFGEFRKPGRYVVLQERLTIFEAIATAGDMTLEAKRSKVMLLRQYPKGTRIHVLNLNKRDIVKSPYYFIQPNDQLYAEPMRVREFGAGASTGQTLQILLTTLSAAALVIGLIK